VLFVASDSMIGIETFRTPFPGSGPAIWVTYYLAQCAIAVGCLRAGRTARVKQGVTGRLNTGDRDAADRSG